MNPKVLDAISLIGRYVADYWDADGNQVEIADELENQGFSNRDISDAFKWIEKNTLGDQEEPVTDKEKHVAPMRAFTAMEMAKMKPAARGLLNLYYARGMIDPILLEDIIDRVMRSETEEVGKKDLRRIAALTLFGQVQAEWKDYLHNTNTLVH